MSLYTGYYKKHNTTQKMTNFPFHFELTVCLSSKKEVYSTTILSTNFTYWIKRRLAKKEDGEKRILRVTSPDWPTKR